MRFHRGNVHFPQRPLLGGHLNRNGVYPASISCFAERHLAYWFCGNFRENIKPTLSGGNDEDAADVNAAAFEWLGRNAQKDNWFLHLNYWEPHTDYIVKREWAQRAAQSGPPPAWPDEDAITRHQEIYGPHSATDLHAGYGRKSNYPDTMPDAIRNRADYEHLINGYDGEICYWDFYFGQLLDELERLGILEETAIIVSADHGESFGENGSYAEHGLANEPTHHIPLIVKWPGLTDDLTAEERRCDALLLNIDLGPTLCELLEFPIPLDWQGRSFARALYGEKVAGRSHLIWSHGAHTFQRAVRTRDHLYIRTLHPGCFRTEPEQLFHVSRDPYLTNDILAQNPAIADAMKAQLFDWWHRLAGAPDAFPDPMQTALDEGPTLYNHPARYVQFLRERGRDDLAQHLTKNSRLR